MYSHALDDAGDTMTGEVFTRLAAGARGHLEVLQAELDALWHRRFWLDDKPAPLQFDDERL